MFFSEEKRIFSKSLSVAILHWNAYQMKIFLKIVFSALIMRYFLAKYQNLFQVGKLRKTYEVFRRKKAFSSFKSLLYTNGKAQNRPVVAGRLVLYQLEMED